MSLFRRLLLQRKTPTDIVIEEMFNYTPIDSAGKYEHETEYDGTPVAYAIGKYTKKFNYYKFTQKTETPTTASGYNTYYVYDESSATYVQCSYSSEVLTPEWVEVGVTPAYNRTQISSTEELNGQEYVFINTSYILEDNNGLNPSYFNGYDFSQVISNASESVYENIEDTWGITTIIIPDTYQGLPVTQILDEAFVAVVHTSQTIEVYPTIVTRYFKLGQNITKLGQRSCKAMCRIPVDNTNRSFVLNTKLQYIGQQALNEVFSDYDITKSIPLHLPSSVTNISATSFNYISGSGRTYLSELHIYSPTIYLSSATYGIVETINKVIFKSSVSSVSGTLNTGTTTTNLGVVIFEHSVDATITLNISKEKNAVTLTIYTDCEAVKNYDWATQNYTVTFYHLDGTLWE